MTRSGKFWLILVIGLVVTMLAGFMTGRWQEVIFTFGLLSVITAIIAASCDEYSCAAGGWGTFFISLIFMFVGGFITKMLFVWLACGIDGVVYGIFVGAIKPREPRGAH
ncbi:MAG: hypothetical protein V1685_06280 [Parcubacteria group bacterium]